MVKYVFCSLLLVVFNMSIFFSFWLLVALSVGWLGFFFVGDFFVCLGGFGGWFFGLFGVWVSRGSGDLFSPTPCSLLFTFINLIPQFLLKLKALQGPKNLHSYRWNSVMINHSLFEDEGWILPCWTKHTAREWWTFLPLPSGFLSPLKFGPLFSLRFLTSK